MLGNYHCAGRASHHCLFGAATALGLLALIALSTGCDGQSGAGNGSGTAADSTAAGSKSPFPRFSIDQLGSPLGDYLPPVDRGRIEIAPPEGWHVEPRDKSYVTRFVVDRTHRAMLPRITITAEDATFDDPKDLDEASLESFRSLIEQQFTEATRKATLESPRCLFLGDVACVRYVVSKRFRRNDRAIPAECQVMKTLHQGRIYTISLDVFSGKLLNHHNDAYAVMAGLIFHDVEVPTEAETETSEAEEPEEDKPKPKDKDEDIDPFG